MTLNELYLLIKDLLKGYTQSENPALVARRITTLISGYSTSDIAARPDTIINNITRQDVEQIINRVKNNDPLEYIFNNASFLDLELYTNSSVLVPRPETEELAMMISSFLNNKTNKQILDIGTGSGCIPIYLALHNANNQYFACDISDKAIATAQQNALKYNLKNIDIFAADIFNYQNNNILSKQTFDIIVSNPPYVA
ncbi:MAG: peptide chain release factor N(5)-glutamine methyltransferase, partial [Bacteroidales bacterium]|nr:peptide chain release factor N(5)-glutamine methyltransferase [Bacteroidales bacterium]